MSRITDVIRRYAASRYVLKHGVEVVVIGDPAGAQLNTAVRDALNQLDEEDADVWAELARAANSLRWRRMMQPQPNAHAPDLSEVVSRVRHAANHLCRFINNESLAANIVSAADRVASTDSPVGAELLRAVEEVGPQRCVVIARNHSARAGLQGWLEQVGVRVVVQSEFDCTSNDIEQSYVVGAPTFFPASVVTAPTTNAITFLMPAWFADRTVPPSSLASYALGGIEIGTRERLVGTVDEPTSDAPEAPTIDDNFFPQTFWGARKSGGRDPEPDETEAWKVLLSAGLGLYLDDGERIRSLDPRQPEGDRISYEAVDKVQPGTYLVLREGATERGAMYDAAVAAVGLRAPSIVATQEQWKRELTARIGRFGVARVVAELAARHVRSATRVRAWTEPTLICPKREENLAALLEWLEIPREPTFTNALTLRRALYRAIADLRYELEEAVAQADLDALTRDGYMRLTLQREGFRSMIVARVIARAPFAEIVPRIHTRVPFPDEGAKWLE